MGHASENGPDRENDDHDMADLTMRTVMRSTRFIRQIMEPFFSSFGISHSQWVVMRVLLAQEKATAGPVRMVDLSGLLMIRQPTLTAAINRLELQGLVERGSSGTGRRGRLVKLSRKGREAMDAMMKLHGNRTRELFSVWDREDMETVVGLFQKLQDHLLPFIPGDRERSSRPYGAKSPSPRSGL